MFPDIAAFMSESSGSGVATISAAADIDLTGLAVAALHDFEVEPSFLHLGAGARRAYRLYRRNRAIANGADLQLTRTNGFAVQMDRAGAAFCDAAPKFRARQSEEIAKRPEKRHVGRSFDIFGLPVHSQGDHALPSNAPRLGAGALNIGSANQKS